MTDDQCELLCLDLDKAERLRAQFFDGPLAVEMAARMRALADSTRLSLARALREGEELCVCDLGWISGRAQNLVSHHLKVLRESGLVERRRDGKMVLYSLTAEGERLVGAALETHDIAS